MITKVSVVDTTYDLFLSILLFADNKSQNIHYFVGGTLRDSTLSHLPHHTQFFGEQFNYTNCFLPHRLFRYLKWPFLLYSELFAQDHLFFSSYIIGFRHYKLIEDSSFIFSWADCSSLFKQIPINGNILVRIAKWFICGPVYQRAMGRNCLCKEIIVTSKTNYDSKYLSNKRVSLFNIKEYWDSSSPEKIDFIKKVFNITAEFLKIEQQYQCVLFTQPLAADFNLTEEEQIDYYRPYIEKYEHLGLTLKIHPRDKVNYQKHFPHIHELNSQAPMQLLSLCGLKYKVSITGFSTAISGLDKETTIIWIGTKQCKKLFSALGDITPPMCR